MGLPQGIVCFVDLLGFKQMVLADSGIGEPKYLPIIETMLSSLRPFLRGEGLELRQFSDSIVISSDYSIENAVKIIGAAADVQWYMVSNGILVRGGIAIGRHYSNGDILYSQGLVQAYTLESTLAKFPRILVDHNLIDLLLGTGSKADQVVERLQDLLVLDRDGYSFVHYMIGKDYDQHESIVNRLLSASDLSKPGLYDKYNWLAEYHNHTVSTIGRVRVTFQLPQMNQWRHDQYHTFSS